MTSAGIDAPFSLPRFAIRGCLGQGAMGVVYRAYDQETSREVALKLLRDLTPENILRFKREFRTLTGLVHPNLVSLYELFGTGDQWFFSMQLVQGRDFRTSIRAGLDPDPAATRALALVDGETAATEVTAPGGGASRGEPAAARADLRALHDPARVRHLRRSLVQLVEGIMALHAAGIIHRDLKPSNVLVDDGGHVFILDFGIARALSAGADDTHTVRLTGTPAYMAPEQAARQPISRASDWYALGVMLFEALTGRRPFEGAPADLLHRKQHLEAPAPSELCARLPPDLDALCVDLLARDPARRPTGTEILRRLGHAPAPPLELPHAVDGAAEVELVGRDAELAVLRRAFARARGGQPTTVFVDGSSGMGKSALVQAFLDGLAPREALILQARCYEQESVPYKALDGLMDALTQHLLALPAADVASMVGDEIGELARLFPVLKQVEWIAGLAAFSFALPDPLERRRRAFAALRRLLVALSGRRPMVLHIDDLQWGDRESATFLDEALRPPDAPRLLFVASYRTEEAETSAFLQAFSPAEDDAIHLVLQRLTEARTQELAAALLAGAGLADRTHLDTICRESAGNPFFVAELARYVCARLDEGAVLTLGGQVTLEDVVRSRLRPLPDGARRLFEVIAVAARPIPNGVARSAADLPHSDGSELLQLRSARLVRTRGMRDGDLVEPYHDRIRELVTAAIEAERLRGLHRRLATAMEQTRDPDSEALASHYERAGAHAFAAAHYRKAAERANEALAFDRSALLYRRALELDPPGADERAALLGRLGEALANAGRCSEAAEVYRAAGEADLSGDALDYERRAAEQLLRSGRIDEGVEAMSAVLRTVGVRPPRSMVGVLGSLLTRRAWLRLRGLRYRSRDAREVGVEKLRRIDVCWSASVAFGMVHTIRGAEIQCRLLQAALGAGEERHLARALSIEACYVASTDSRGYEKAYALAERVREIAERTNDRISIGWAACATAVATYLSGDFPAARDRCLTVDEVLLNGRSAGLAWEFYTVQLVNMWSLFYLGEVRDLARRIPNLVREARQRGDLYNVTNLSTSVCNFAWLVVDRPEDARRHVERAMADWSPREFQLQHYWAMVALTQVDLYVGDGEAALARMLEGWPAMKRSLLLKMPFTRMEATALRARAYLAAASGPRGDACLRAAARDAAWLERTGIAWTGALARLVRAGLAAGRNEIAEAVALFAEAEHALETLGMKLYAAAARRRRGLLVGGAEGEALVAEVDAWMGEQAIERPAQVMRALAP